MKNANKIQFKALILLVLYVFSTLPAMLWHEHEQLVSFEKASACEKTILFGENSNNCNHKSHVAISHKKCSLCDQNTTNPHLSDLFIFDFAKTLFILFFSDNSSEYLFTTTHLYSNRGPPLG